MEKYRFYCELPGDIWEDGYFMQLIKMNQVHGAAMRVHPARLDGCATRAT